MLLYVVFPSVCVVLTSLSPFIFTSTCSPPTVLPDDGITSTTEKSEQLSAPTPLVDMSGQSKQALLPSIGAYFPASQTEQETLPSPSELVLPLGQFKQESADTAPTDEPYLPAGHAAEQLDMESLGLK